MGFGQFDLSSLPGGFELPLVAASLPKTLALLLGLWLLVKWISDYSRQVTTPASKPPLPTFQPNPASHHPADNQFHSPESPVSNTDPSPYPPSSDGSVPRASRGTPSRSSQPRTNSTRAPSSESPCRISSWSSWRTLRGFSSISMRRRR